MIGLYSPELPPVPGGVADHTLVLARALQAQGHPPAVLGRDGDPGLFAPLTCRAGLAPTDLPRVARELGLTALLVQYVPFAFARRGIAPRLCLGIRWLADAGLVIAVVLHEPYVPFTRLPWLVTGWPMRWQLRVVLRHAAFVYAPVPRYAEIARGYAPRATVRLAPVGATLPVSAAGRDEARRALGLEDGEFAIGVFSPAAAGFRRDWIEEAARRLAAEAGRQRVTWVVFGNGADRVLAGPPAGVAVRRVTERDAGVVGRTMRAVDAAAAPYVDGLTMRRTGAMLALAHGIPTVSSTGPLFDPRLADLAACEASAGALSERLARLMRHPAERAALAARAAGYRDIASVEVLARHVVADLNGNRGSLA